MVNSVAKAKAKARKTTGGRPKGGDDKSERGEDRLAAAYCGECRRGIKMVGLGERRKERRVKQRR